MQLSEHFSLEEMTVSQTAARRGIDNTPSPEIVENLKKVCDVLEQIRAVVGRPILVSSGYRCPELNDAVGGARDSAHTKGLAADINAQGMTPLELANRIRHAGIVYDQLIFEFERWIHIGLSDKPRHQVLTAKLVNGATHYFIGIV